MENNWSSDSLQWQRWWEYLSMRWTFVISSEELEPLQSFEPNARWNLEITQSLERQCTEPPNVTMTRIASKEFMTSPYFTHTLAMYPANVVGLRCFLFFSDVVLTSFVPIGLHANLRAWPCSVDRRLPSRTSGFPGWRYASWSIGEGWSIHETHAPQKHSKPVVGQGMPIDMFTKHIFPILNTQVMFFSITSHMTQFTPNSNWCWLQQPCPHT